MLDGIPGSTENGNSHGASNGEATEPSDDSNQETVANGKDTATLDPAAIDENSTTTSFTEDSMDKPATPITASDHAVVGASEDTNDSIITNDSSNNATPRPTDSEDTEEDSQDAQEPPTKKSKKWPDRLGDATSNNVSTFVPARSLSIIAAPRRRFWIINPDDGPTDGRTTDGQTNG